MHWKLVNCTVGFQNEFCCAFNCSSCLVPTFNSQSILCHCSLSLPPRKTSENTGNLCYSEGIERDHWQEMAKLGLSNAVPFIEYCERFFSNGLIFYVFTHVVH